MGRCASVRRLCDAGLRRDRQGPATPTPEENDGCWYADCVRAVDQCQDTPKKRRGGTFRTASRAEKKVGILFTQPCPDVGQASPTRITHCREGREMLARARP